MITHAFLSGKARIARLLQRKPGLSGIASSLRDALDTVPGWALLAGGVMAGHTLAECRGLATLALDAEDGRAARTAVRDATSA